MGYVKTPQELERFRALADFRRGVSYCADVLSIAFTTTEEFVAEVLPPCFEPAGRPAAFASIGAWRKLLDGVPARGEGAAFENAVVWIAARYGDVEGWYALTMIVSGDMPITLGRETTGEPKKRGRARLYRDGARVSGWAERAGTRLIEIDAELGPELGPAVEVERTLELKACLAPDAAGLQWDPLVTVLRVEHRHERRRAGAGTLRLRGTPVDPLDTIPVVSVGEATHSEGAATVAVESQTALPDGNRLLPWIVGRSYDDVAAWGERERTEG